MIPSRILLLQIAVCLAATAQTTPDVGSGSPTTAIQQQFQLAFYRNGFAYTVSLPPLADVKKFGTNGLVQEFSDASKTANVKFALIMPNINAPINETSTAVFQVQGAMYSYYSSVGVTTAGTPTIDTTACPALINANACQYQTFNKNYVLFVYKNTVNLNGATFATRDPYYTKWNSVGGIGTMGPATTAETAVTSSTGATGTEQTFDQGAVFNFTTGLNAGKQLAIKPVIWATYLNNNSQAGSLGFPISDEMVQPNGHLRQSFEGGNVDYDPTAQPPAGVILVSVASLAITPSDNTIKLKLNDTMPLQVRLYDAAGNLLIGRNILWTTSNSRVISLQPSGDTVILKAVGGGSATIRATSEGKTSAAITLSVTAPCCQVGEGAPSSSIAQAFQDAVSRNRLNLMLPAAAAVTRAGAGYVQQLTSSDGGQTYLVAVPDKVLTGFVVSGRLLAAYLAMGGPGGSLGYPISDATAGGRQVFENGALAGNPALLVAGDILIKWGVLGFETGIAGPPTGMPAAFLTFKATRGQAQAFNAAVIYSVNTALGLKDYVVTGLILAKYLAASGPAGSLGAPLNDEFGVNNRRHQDFEGGFIDYASGDASAQITENKRQPIVTAAPGSVVAGTQIRLAVGGFSNNAQLRVSIAGQADFMVTVPTGAYVWDAFIPSTAKSGSVTIKAVDVSNPSMSAQGSYTVRAAADVHLKFAVVRGDNQAGAPGALLPAALVATLSDESGNPIPAMDVEWAASPGARIESTSGPTDVNGQASAVVRLPPSDSLALVTATAAKLIATFSARGSQISLTGFPHVTQLVDGILGGGPGTIAQKGALLASAVAILRYHQGRSELPTPNGLADVAALNNYLKSYCAADALGITVCDGYLTVGTGQDPVVNLWRLGGFAGNSVEVSVERPDVNSVRDLLAQGSPVLLALSLTSGAAPLGAHFVVATGVAANGDLRLEDPNPAFGRLALNDYLTGFAAPGGTVQGTITGAVRLIPRTPKTQGFLIAANAKVDITSPTGACGVSFGFPGQIAVSPTATITSAFGVQLRGCDGAASAIYQLDLSGDHYSGTFTDLGTPVASVDLSGSGPTTVKIAKNGTRWAVSPMTTAILPGGVVSAATLTPDLAPGGIASIFGAGFGRIGSTAAVQVNGTAAQVLASFPFQVNVQMPPDASPGLATLHLDTDFGSADQPITLLAVAPEIFVLGPDQGAVVNQNGKLNTPFNPAIRGQAIVIFGTGLGSTSLKGGFMAADAPVTLNLGGASLPSAFAGLTPGFVSLYQVNLIIPSPTPPGLGIPLSVQQGNSTSNTVKVAIQ